MFAKIFWLLFGKYKINCAALIFLKLKIKSQFGTSNFYGNFIGPIHFFGSILLKTTVYWIPKNGLSTVLEVRELLLLHIKSLYWVCLLSFEFKDNLTASTATIVCNTGETDNVIFLCWSSQQGYLFDHHLWSIF